MALKSKQVEALDQEPRQVLQTGVLGGRVRIAQFEVDLEGEADGTPIEILDLPVNAVLVRVNLFQDASGDTTTYNVGDSNDPDGIIDGQTIDQSLRVSIDRQTNSGDNGMKGDDFLKQLWEVLGYSSRVAAGRSVRLTLTPDGSAANDGTKVFGNVMYVVD